MQNIGTPTIPQPKAHNNTVKIIGGGVNGDGDVGVGVVCGIGGRTIPMPHGKTHIKPQVVTPPNGQRKTIRFHVILGLLQK